MSDKHKADVELLLLRDYPKTRSCHRAAAVLSGLRGLPNESKVGVREGLAHLVESQTLLQTLYVLKPGF